LDTGIQTVLRRGEQKVTTVRTKVTTRRRQTFPESEVSRSGRRKKPERTVPRKSWARANPVEEKPGTRKRLEDL